MPSSSTKRSLFMNITCDICNKGNQGKYTTRYYDTEAGRELKTICWECLDEKPTSGRTDSQFQEHINTPYWVHGGLKPSPQEKAAYEYKKVHNMSWTDLKKVRELGKPRYPSALKEFLK